MRHFPAPITDRKIRFALVGCGRIAQNHFAALKQHADRAELVSVCDIDSKALEAAAKLTGAKPFTNLASLLADTTADIVILTTPSGLHPQQTIDIAASGRHVMTEKPMATRWHDGLRMVKACDDATPHCNCSSALLTKAASGEFTWSTSTYSGLVPKSITTAPHGVVLGSLTVELS